MTVALPYRPYKIFNFENKQYISNIQYTHININTINYYRLFLSFHYMCILNILYRQLVNI